MRILGHTLLAFIVIATAGCARSTTLQSDQSSSALLAPSPSLNAGLAQGASRPSNPGGAAPGKPEIDPTYANGTTVYMIGTHTVVGAKTTMPNAYENAEELYLIVFPQTTTPTPESGPITLPSGYQPQCNPCFHPGLPAPFVYHDHVITGAPGMGKNGTAGDYLAPWKIIVLMYNPAYVASPGFTPLTSEAAVDAAEQAGNVLLPINTGGANPYEVETGNLLICPTVSSHA